MLLLTAAAQRELAGQRATLHAHVIRPAKFSRVIFKLKL
jgi:hypothetical protein